MGYWELEVLGTLVWMRCAGEVADRCDCLRVYISGDSLGACWPKIFPSPIFLCGNWDPQVVKDGGIVFGSQMRGELHSSLKEINTSQL